MKRWAAVAGLALTCAGILVGFSLPTTVARWSGYAEIAAEHFTQIRAYIGTALVLVGTGAQIYSAWPQKISQ
ncbi:hypothetical protein CR492_08505 [Methylocella silvestris]|uniref:Uncharacterized protein n=1 Tax=Methylocella silvestris TaxID=199596 RepID=A0A2J7TI36_METSI|nr:hypothetical protein CR492_08505 [Methylocella silvestris]